MQWKKTIKLDVGSDGKTVVTLYKTEIKEKTFYIFEEHYKGVYHSNLYILRDEWPDNEVYNLPRFGLAINN